MNDLDKIREHLIKIIEKYRFTTTNTALGIGLTVRKQPTRYGVTGEYRASVHITNKDISDHFRKMDILLADPDCFKKFEEWVKGLK